MNLCVAVLSRVLAKMFQVKVVRATSLSLCERTCTEDLVVYRLNPSSAGAAETQQ